MSIESSEDSEGKDMSIASMIAKAGHTVELQRPTVLTDEYGSKKRVWSTVASDVEAWVQPASRAIVEMYGKKYLTVTHRIHVKNDLGVKVGDRIVYGERYMIVHGVYNIVEMNKLWIIDCEERD